jgi:signal transduction histidine kinase
LRDERGNIVKWYGSHTDIEDRKQAEQAQRRTEAYLCHAQRLSRVGSFGWTPSTGEIHWSDESFRIFELDRSVKPTIEFILQRVHPEDVLLVRQAIDLVSQGRLNFDFTHRLVMPSGPAMFDAGSSFLGYRGVGTDVTAAVRASQAEEALHQARAELSHVSRVTTLGQLTASIAHEVNQPLAAIVANADASLRWLNRERPEIEEARRSLERIVLDADRASAVIQRTRQLSKRADPEKVHLDINDVINDAMLLVQREAASHQVSLRLDLASGLPTVFGDRVLLQQVIINLVMNGIEAMASADNLPRELLIRSGRHKADQVVIAVKDVGVGIDPETANKLFNAFFTTKPGGLGMGLSICRSIIEAHDGRLWASRNSGPGTTFRFSLHAHPAS